MPKRPPCPFCDGSDLFIKPPDPPSVRSYAPDASCQHDVLFLGAVCCNTCGATGPNRLINVGWADYVKVRKIWARSRPHWSDIFLGFVVGCFVVAWLHT